MRHTIKQIEQAVADLSGLTVADVFADRRFCHLIIIRGILFNIAKENGYAQTHISDAVGCCHANVAHVQKALFRYDTEDSINAHLQAVRDELARRAM